MLDHVFTDAIDSLRQSLEAALLERLAHDERLHVDILLGDLTWETSYGLLGEASPARVRADINMQWSTWSQSAFRDWYAGDGFSMPPRIDLEVTLRVQRLTSAPDVAAVYAATPTRGPSLGNEPLYRSGPTVEQAHNQDLSQTAAAVEVAYNGGYDLDEAALEDSALVDVSFAEIGGWIASSLVRMNDLGLDFLPSAVPDDL